VHPSRLIPPRRLHAARMATGRFSPESSGGYTFLELLVVITLVGLFLFFAVPRIAPDAPSDDFRRAINWFTLNIPALKRQAVSENTPLYLQVDRKSGRLWISKTDDLEEAGEDAESTAFVLPDSVSIREIALYGRTVPESGPVTIRFLPNGTSDYLKLKIIGDSGSSADIHIEPFLYAAKILHISS
jgi:Tfp pilus assembly protein FimT